MASPLRSRSPVLHHDKALPLLEQRRHQPHFELISP
jgi:hypothetical protein